MLDNIFETLEIINSFFWSYIGFTLIIACGIYFTIKSNFFQFRTLKRPRKCIRDLHESAQKGHDGIHPLKLYFASVGGMVGLGNMVGIIMALMIGGPGGLFWLWVASFCGMLIKYGEIYLGVHFRVPNGRGGYDGGPMFYLKEAFRNRYIPLIVSILLCIYGVEVVQFLIITDTVVKFFAIDKHIVIIGLLAFTLYTGLGGINRLATICTILMPVFIIIYVIMCLWVLVNHASEIPNTLSIVFHSAFNGHAAVGGFAGSTFVLAAQKGIAQAVYSGDIGIGYDSIIQAETKTQHPEKQARMAVFALATDTIICTMSMLVVLVTKVWHGTDKMQPSEFITKALGMHFPYIETFMAIFFFLAGFTTIIAYFSVGIKSSAFIAPKWGRTIYIAYAIFAFSFFSFFDQNKVMLIMSLSGGFLMMLNLMGMIRLRHHIKFH
ncbi:MAG: amino acid carrier protein [Alphaproteobacteria bacterium]|nr:amino acid carrier protein [Alphaproteobacteria bacterium]